MRAVKFKSDGGKRTRERTDAADAETAAVEREVWAVGVLGSEREVREVS